MRFSGDECHQCKIDLCEMTVCKSQPNARCVSVECGCEAYYVDENGDIVNCVAIGRKRRFW